MKINSRCFNLMQTLTLDKPNINYDDDKLFNWYVFALKISQLDETWYKEKAHFCHTEYIGF
ncbi:hypothetical protein T4D_11387 [Trichinella pseudospiralis]|uniref:Uncharacterized protein n=1 Tax=Trichinella pseudospiralis TaxID=6337 RepID=A0A0V1FBA9_TRIPS|nr:hypothetical protein T4D_11387 [Trichinella pseudospiralis]